MQSGEPAGADRSIENSRKKVFHLPFLVFLSIENLISFLPFLVFLSIEKFGFLFAISSFLSIFSRV